MKSSSTLYYFTLSIFSEKRICCLIRYALVDAAWVGGEKKTFNFLNFFYIVFALIFVKIISFLYPGLFICLLPVCYMNRPTAKNKLNILLGEYGKKLATINFYTLYKICF